MKTARAVQPNLGRQAKFKKKLDTFLRSFRNRILNEILLYLSDAGGLTEDASLTFRPDDPLDRARLRNIKERINRLVLRDPDRFRRNVDDFIARNMGNWMKTADRETRQIAEWYVKNLATDVSTAQKASLLAAGVPASVFAYEMRQTRKHFFITPQAVNELPRMVADTTSLISNITTSELANIRGAFMDAYEGHGTYSQIVEALGRSSSFTAQRAQRVAIDQKLKLNQQIQQANCKGLGVTRGIWIHVPGKYTSRESHIEMNGKEFDLSKGMYDKEVGRNVMPGELYFCRCQFRAVLPD